MTLEALSDASTQPARLPSCWQFQITKVRFVSVRFVAPPAPQRTRTLRRRRTKPGRGPRRGSRFSTHPGLWGTRLEVPKLQAPGPPSPDPQTRTQLDPLRACKIHEVSPDSRLCRKRGALGGRAAHTPLKSRDASAPQMAPKEPTSHPTVLQDHRPCTRSHPWHLRCVRAES